MSAVRAGAAAALPYAALVVGLLTIYSWFVPEPGPNELSHLDLVYALVHDRQTAIDRYAANTIDRSALEGHFYANKAPGLAFLAGGLLFAADRALGLGRFGDVRISYVAHLLTVGAVALPTALLAGLVALVARRLGARPAAAAGAALAMALATALVPFATTLYSHATAAALSFLCFALASCALLPSRPRLALFLAGLAAAAAATVEYPAALVGVLIGAMLLLRRTAPDRAAAYAAGGALGLAPLLLYDWASFGAPWRLSYAYTDFRAFGGMTAGLFGVGLPSASGLAEITIGPAGLLDQSPFFLLAPIGLLLLGRRAPGLGLAAGATVVAFLVYNAGFWAPMGGQSSGPRYLLPAIPFLALGLAFVPGRLWLLIAPLALYGFVHVLAIAAVEPKTGPGHPNALFDYWLPRLAAGDVALSWAELRLGLRGTAILAPLAVPLAVVALAVLALAGRPRARRRAEAGLLALGLLQWALLVAPFGRGGTPERFRVAVTDGPRQIGVVYGGAVELLGYRAPTEVAPGDLLELDLFWRALGPVDENLTAFVHAVDPGGSNLGGRDLAPAGPGFPTNLWRPGQILRTPFRFRIASDAAAPAALSLVVGLYGPGGSPLPARDPSGRPTEPGPAVVRLALRPATPVAPDQVHLGRAVRSLGRDTPRRFEGGLELLDWSAPEQARAGAKLDGTLRLRAWARPERDATIFVQALGPDRPIAQWDAQPLGGRYPTSLWPIGETIDDRFGLTIPAGTPPGDYRLIAGLYLLPEVARLRLEGGGDVVELGSVRIAP
ncbi:MAG TPA: hypothetical protein VGM69_22535 [Chloroflexota bacterium]